MGRGEGLQGVFPAQQELTWMTWASAACIALCLWDHHGEPQSSFYFTRRTENWGEIVGYLAPYRPRWEEKLPVESIPLWGEGTIHPHISADKGCSQATHI